MSRGSAKHGQGAVLTKKYRIMKQECYVSEIELSYTCKIEKSNRKTVKTSEQVNELLRTIWSGDMTIRESFYLLLFSQAGDLTGWYKIGSGGITGVIADIRLIFAIACKSLSPSIIIAHNHPSGSLIPSQTDITTTDRIVKGGAILDIKVLDHLILNEDSYYSFADNGRI